jgi:hypothetical protein
MDQLLGELRQLIQAAVEAVFHDHILALEVSSLSEALLKRLDEGLGRLALT